MATRDFANANRRRSSWKTSALFFLLIIALGYVLIPIIWWLINGVILPTKLASDPAFHKEISAILSSTELKAWEDSTLKTLPQEKQVAVELIIEKYLQRTEWLPLQVLSNFATFSILGLLLGLIGVQRYWFIVPLCLLPSTLFINAPHIDKSLGVKLGVLLVVQMGSVYLLAAIGTWLIAHRR